MMFLPITCLALAALHGTYCLAVVSDSNSGQGVSDLKLLTARLTLLEGRVQKLGDLEQRVEHLEHVVRVQSSHIQSQSRQLKTLKNILKQTTKPKSYDNESLVNLNAGNYQRDKKHDEADTELSPGQQSGSTDLESAENTVLNRGIREAAGAAFSVYLNHDTGHLGEHQVVKYNTIQFNDGNGYNQFTGSFICPVSGVYLFLYNMGHQGVGQTWLELMVNGQKMNSATVQTYHGSEENQAGNSLIVHLSTGDAVWVEAWDTGDDDHDNVLNGKYLLTTFAGVRIY